MVFPFIGSWFRTRPDPLTGFTRPVNRQNPRVYIKALSLSQMVAMDDVSGSKKRKRDPPTSNFKGGDGRGKPFKSKFGSNKDPKPFSKPGKPAMAVEKKKEPTTPRERRLAAKEMVEERKKKRKPTYDLEKELAALWGKMRCSKFGKEARSKLVDIIMKLGLQKSSVLQHMASVIQPILEKGILDCSIIHTVLLEYFTIADKSSASDVIQQLSPLLTQESSGIDEGPQASKKRENKKTRTKIPLVRMASTRDGLKVGILCIKHGSAKERKKIVKGIKEYVRKLALDQYGNLLLTCILSVVDDTKLVTKIVIRELQSMLKELVLDWNGRLPLLQLLHPQCPRYLGQENLACLSISVTSLCTRGEGDEAIAKEQEGSEKPDENDVDVPMKVSASSGIGEKTTQSALGGKKDPCLRRRELLVESGLAERLVDICIENISELLRSNFGRKVIYELLVEQMAFCNLYQTNWMPCIRR